MIVLQTLSFHGRGGFGLFVDVVLVSPDPPLEDVGGLLVDWSGDEVNVTTGESREILSGFQECRGGGNGLAAFKSLFVAFCSAMKMLAAEFS